MQVEAFRNADQGPRNVCGQRVCKRLWEPAQGPIQRQHCGSMPSLEAVQERAACALHDLPRAHGTHMHGASAKGNQQHPEEGSVGQRRGCRGAVKSTRTAWWWTAPGAWPGRAWGSARRARRGSASGTAPGASGRSAASRPRPRPATPPAARAPSPAPPPSRPVRQIVQLLRKKWSVQHVATMHSEHIPYKRET